jgi:hypothetical protein
MNASSLTSHDHFLQLTNELMQAWRELAAEATTDDASPRMQAYLLLNRWADNPLAAAFADSFPVLAADRRAVPAPRFENRMDRAPFLVGLPEALAPWAPVATRAADSARDVFAKWLADAWLQSARRLPAQDFGAVVFSREGAASIADHWAVLGRQKSPTANEYRRIRFQDPRVMQRVWRSLSTSQRRLWLGPVVQWWALVQPWGPWEPTQYPNGVPSGATDDVHWFRALMPALQGGPEHSMGSALFDPNQWHVAHIAATANRVWAGYANEKVPVQRQPDGDTVIRLLGDSRRLGLSGANQLDYVWCSWQHNAPEGRERELSWQAPRAARVLNQVLEVLRQQPDARFANLYLDALKQRLA